MKHIIEILFKQLMAISAKEKELLINEKNCKKLSQYHYFDVFTFPFITFNTEFIPQAYNYGRNFPRSGIMFLVPAVFNLIL